MVNVGKYASPMDSYRNAMFFPTKRHFTSKKLVEFGSKKPQTSGPSTHLHAGEDFCLQQMMCFLSKYDQPHLNLFCLCMYFFLQKK